MFILRDLLTPLQEEFSNTEQGGKEERFGLHTRDSRWWFHLHFQSPLICCVLCRLCLVWIYRVSGFTPLWASTTLPWKGLWQTMWGIIPAPATEERIIVALDDSINPKSGKKIFGCGHFHDHAGKGNQSSYPWSQCILVIGLLKKVKSRWACLPLDFRFYMMQKDIEAEAATAKRQGKVLPFESKMEQAASMIKEVHNYFQQSVLIVADSWFGNDGLWSRLDRGSEGCFHLLSRMRTNNTLYNFAHVSPKKA